MPHNAVNADKADSKPSPQETEFADAFLSQNGILLLANAMMGLTGNSLAYCLQALEGAMQHMYGWTGLEERHIRKLFDFVRWSETGANKTNVVSHAIAIGVLVASNPEYGFQVIHSALLKNAEEENEVPYSGIIACIGSTSDLKMQTNALRLVNKMMENAPTQEVQDELFETLIRLNIHRVLQQHANLENWKEQIYHYQCNRLERYNRLKKLPYDKTNPEHEATLMKLWAAVFPDQELKSRVNDQWKEMGFQGQDPATDFRGMGMLGLDNLLYIADNHPVIFRRIVKEQSSRDENDYPVAVTGISITQLLFTLFKVGAERAKPADQVVYPILFDHDHALEEMYCIIFQLLDRTWDEMNAAYMDFPRVLDAVKKKVTEVLESSDTLNSFQKGCSKGTPVEAFLRSEQAEENQVQITIPDFDIDPAIREEIESSIRREIDELVREQKRQALREGAVFRELDIKQKGKNQTNTHFQIQCSADEKELRWERINDRNATVENPSNSIIVEDLAAVLTGQDNPLLAKLKKADEDILTFGFSLQMQDGSSFDLIAQSQDDFVNWTDGIRLLMGLEVESPDTFRAMEILVNAGTCVRLMNLEGINLPKKPLEVPELPPHYNFFLRDNKEIEVQNQPKAQ